MSALVLRVGESGVAPSEVDRLLEGVYLELAPVMVDAGADYVAAADAVLALVAGLDAGTRAQLSIDLGADQLTAPLNGRPAPSVDDVVATASRAAGYDGGVRAITGDGPAFHNLGACASWELAGSVAAGVAYLRLLGEAARGAGLSQIYLAGPQKAVADVDEDGRPDDYLTAKIDAVEALSTLLTRLGA